MVVGSESMAVFDDTQAWSNKLQLYPHKVEIKDDIPIASKADAVAVDVLEDEPLKLRVQPLLGLRGQR